MGSEGVQISEGEAFIVNSVVVSKVQGLMSLQLVVLWSVRHVPGIISECPAI